MSIVDKAKGAADAVIDLVDRHGAEGATRLIQASLRDDCERCGLTQTGRRQADDCHMCDPLCPIWGTHGHLWDGDEESSRAAYLAQQEGE